MKYVDEFRNSTLANSLVDQIRSRCTRQWTIMEVCGGQTHSLLRHGIDQALSGVVELLHGPGCPVCVTPAEAIDQAIHLAERSDTILASFGDMLRVPGSTGSLLQARGRGADVRVVYSPLDAVQLALKNPLCQVVFFAVGFETTAPATALAVLQAEQSGLKNFKVLTCHVRVLPAMEAIAQLSDSQVQGFLAAGHVCAVTGFGMYQSFIELYRLPVVVTGFEPIDLLHGIFECIEMLETGRVAVGNAYARCVQMEGNQRAQQMISEVFDICDRPWRGMGLMNSGGFALRRRFRALDALLDLEWVGNAVDSRKAEPDARCRSGDVMSGRIRPPECPHFGLDCNPQQPLGAPMVSSEGSCAAYFTYQKGVLAHSPVKSLS